MKPDTLMDRIVNVLMPFLDPEDAEIAAREIFGVMYDLPDNLGNYLPRDYKPGSHSASDIWRALVGAAMIGR